MGAKATPPQGLLHSTGHANRRVLQHAVAVCIPTLVLCLICWHIVCSDSSCQLVANPPLPIQYSHAHKRPILASPVTSPAAAQPVKKIARSEGVLANGTVLAGLAPVDCSKGRVLSFIAHIDDDLLFMNPSIWRAITGGKCVRTVTTTAGDAGLGQKHSSYWKGREAGHRAAYADMIGVANSSWAFGDAGVAGRSILMATSTANPKVSLVWMRLPDGGVKGGGFRKTGSVSLQKLWNGNATSLSALDGSATYTRDELQGTLREIMSDFEPTEIKTLNYVNETGDHPDHFITARFVQAAVVRTPSGDLSARLTSYIGYPVDRLPANVNGTELTAKESAWYTYAALDKHMCKTPKSCATNFIGPWLSREYTVTN